jgi:hypothetical protein
VSLHHAKDENDTDSNKILRKEVAIVPPTTKVTKVDELKRAEDDFDPKPTIQVLGRMDAKYAIRLGWENGIHTISPQRLTFLKNEMGMNVEDDPDNYVL